MKTNKLNWILFAFSILMLMQSCQVTFYKSGNTCLQDAVKSKRKTKIIQKDGKRKKYSQIKLSEYGQFIGNKRIKGIKNQFEKILIDENTVSKVKLENQKLNSTIYGATYIITFIGFLILAIIYVYPWMFGY